MLVGPFAECLPQTEDVLGQGRLGDEGVGPHHLQELVLGHDLALPLDERRQGGERLRGERNGLALPQQEPPEWIEPEPFELVNALFFLRHRSSNKI